MVEIRTATEADRVAIAQVEAFSFNSQNPDPADVRVTGALCAAEGDRVVGTASVYQLDQWFGGAKVPCAGVSGVAVLPEHRGRGVASTLVAELLSQRRAAGDALSVLYPANSQLYRKLGYEYAGLQPTFLVPVCDLPASRAAVELASLDEGCVAELRRCFSRFAALHNGPVEWADPGHWAQRVLAHKGEGLHQRTVVAPATEGLEGYASYFTAYDTERQAVVARCKHLIALSARAFGAILGYFRRFENSARYLGWSGPPSTAPVGLAAATDGFSIICPTRRWMLRIVDLPRALEARGYPAGADAEVSFCLEDPLFTENVGPWRLRVTEGRGRVERTPTSSARPLPIGLFSSLYSGFASPFDLVSLGALDPGDPLVPGLAKIFYGPVPWMPDFF
jgi:predicted acetyltransferase